MCDRWCIAVVLRGFRKSEVYYGKIAVSLLANTLLCAFEIVKGIKTTGSRVKRVYIIIITYRVLQLPCSVTVGVVSFGSHLGEQYALVIKDSNQYTRSIIDIN